LNWVPEELLSDGTGVARRSVITDGTGITEEGYQATKEIFTTTSKRIATRASKRNRRMMQKKKLMEHCYYLTEQ